MSKVIGMIELERQISHIMDTVQEEMAEYVITIQNEPVAVLRPFKGESNHAPHQREIDAELEAMKSLANDIAEAWVSPKSGVELVEEQRRY